MDVGPVTETGDPATTVTIADESDLQPVRLFVNKNLAEPGEIPITVPVLVTEAINGLEDTHVPPDEGSRAVTDPVQICCGPSKTITGMLFILMLRLTGVTQPKELVNLNCAFP